MERKKYVSILRVSRKNIHIFFISRKSKAKENLLVVFSTIWGVQFVYGKSIITQIHQFLHGLAMDRDK